MRIRGLFPWRAAFFRTKLSLPGRTFSALNGVSLSDRLYRLFNPPTRSLFHVGAERACSQLVAA